MKIYGIIAAMQEEMQEIKKIMTEIEEKKVCELTFFEGKINEKNVVLAIATNDALSNSGKNIMQILNTKHFYLVPMFQDDIFKKPNSLIAKNDLIIQTMINALVDKQLQPLFLLKKEK